MATPHIDRRCHWLRRNRKSRRPELLLFVDVESHRETVYESAELHTFRLGWACLCKYEAPAGLQVLGWHQIADLAEFWRRVTEYAYQHDELYVITHNVDYDARVLRAFTILPGMGWSPSYFILADTCRFFSFAADKHTIHFLDNLNIWPTSLAELGREFGLPKSSVDFVAASDAELSSYCHRDVEILVRVWQHWLEFLDSHDLGDFAITISSQAWNAYRHRYIPKRIGIHNRVDALELERRSHLGGRCEYRRVGKVQGGPFYLVDVNGLYAYCMREYPSPRLLIKVLVDVSPDYLAILVQTYAVIADVIVDTDLPIYPVRLHGYNEFPCGSFRTCLTTPDLLHALQRGHIRAVGQVAIYEREHLFRAFVDHFQKARISYQEAGDNARQLICKQIRNSLYGKFAQRGYKQKVIGPAPLDAIGTRKWIDAETGNECVDWTFGGQVIRQVYTGEGADSFPGISSHIAAAARSVLLDYITKAGEDNVYYCDTDSLIVNQAGLDALQPWIDATELGCLKLQGKSQELEIQARKSYFFNGAWVIKGISKNAFLQDSGTWKQTQFTTLRWGFHNRTLDDVITYDVEKDLRETVQHGTVRPDGRVDPPHISLDQDQVGAIVSPESSEAWTWWLDSPWYASLETRRRESELPDWYLRALRDETTGPPTF
jgi:hypothetical protein